MNAFATRRDRPRVLAHRGAHHTLPENTIPAFVEGMRQGADGVELDVRLCRDGAVIVFHDDALDRLAHRPGHIAAIDRAALSAIDLGEGAPIPLLHDALDAVLALGGLVNVEVKQDAAVPRRRAIEAVVAVLHARAPVERDALVLSTFDPGLFAGLRALVRHVPVAFLYDVEHRRGGEAFTTLVRPAGVHPHHSLVDRARVDALHARGAFVNVWTVDDPAVATRLAPHVDGIITNDVPAILSALAR